MYTRAESSGVVFFLKAPTVGDISELLQSYPAEIDRMLNTEGNIGAQEISGRLQNVFADLASRCIKIDKNGDNLGKDEFISLPVGLQLEILDMIWQESRLDVNTVKKILMGVYSMILEMGKK